MVVEAEGSMQMTPTSMYNTYKVFHNHRMLWMRICMSPYHITTDLFCKSFGDFSRILVTTLRRKIPHSVVVEAVDPFQMTPTSMFNTFKVFHNPHHMYGSFTTLLLTSFPNIFLTFLELWLPPEGKNTSYYGG